MNAFHTTPPRDEAFACVSFNKNRPQYWFIGSDAQYMHFYSSLVNCSMYDSI